MSGVVFSRTIAHDEVVEDRGTVDDLHERPSGRPRDPPHENERDDIYQFFADDPESRTLEIQTFLPRRCTRVGGSTSGGRRR